MALFHCPATCDILACDDGMFCNGAEQCNALTGNCNDSPSDPCGPREVCDEEGNRCLPEP